MRHLIGLLVLAFASTVLGQNSSIPIPESKKVAMMRSAEFRILTKTDGTKIRARPVAFSEANNTIKLEAGDGLKYGIKLPDLSEADQLYIKDWIEGYSKVRVQIDERIDADKLFKGNLDSWASMFPNMKYGDHWRAEKDGTTYEEVSYELNIENISTQKLTDIIVEYCVYHETLIEEEYMTTKYSTMGSYPADWVGYPNEGGKYPEQVVSNTIRGTAFFHDITEGKKVSVLTQPLKLVEKAEEKTAYQTDQPKVGDRGTRNTRTIRGTLLGIRCRIHVPTESGNYAMIETSVPSSLRLNTEWISP